MNTTQLVVLAWIYLSPSDCLVFNCWIHATLLFPGSIAQTWPFIHHFVKLFPKTCTKNNLQSHHGCSDQSDGAQPIAVTTCSAL